VTPARLLFCCSLSVVVSACTAAAQPSLSSPVSPSPSEFPILHSDLPPTPQRLTITISVADPADLKVVEGDRLRAGDLIADRTIQRQRLEAQKRQLEVTLQRLQTATITQPLSPAPVPAMAALPPLSYVEEQAAIERTQVAVDQAERLLNQKKEEIAYLQTLANLDPLVLEHEQAKLVQLQQDHTAAVRDYQLAVGRLGKSQDDYAYREYQHTLALAERVEQANQDALAHQRQWAEYEQRLRDRDFQVAQTQLKLDEVENAIATLSVVRSPYDGRIRRIKWLGQAADGALSAEITLLVRSSSGPGDPPATPLSGQQSPLLSHPDRAGHSEFVGN
jgi:hypothetical protein